jgi:purine nucleosidase
VRNRQAHFDYLDRKARGSGARFWAHLPPPRPPRIEPSQLKAHELIIDRVRSYPGEIALVMVGSLTNLALALLVEPGIASLIQRVFHMGGGFTPTELGDGPLNWDTPDIPSEVWRETLRFNTQFDPEASTIVFNSGIPLTLVPVNITAQVFQRLAELDRLQDCRTPYHDHLHTYGRPWVIWSREVRQLPGAHMHDPLTLAVAIDPTLCHYRTMKFDQAKLLADNSGWLGGPVGSVQLQVAVSVDACRCEALLARHLLRALP